jgi:hypothetical protein
MKKNVLKSVFGLAMASMMLTACSNADEGLNQNTAPSNGDTAINFGAYMNRSVMRGGTVGELTDATALQGAGFGVLAYYTDNKPYAPDALPNFMYNQEVTYAGSAWTYSPLKYWPNEYGAAAASTGVDMLSFFAYAPYTQVDLTSGMVAAPNDQTGIIALTRATENGDPKVRYVASLDPATKVDLCWANPIMNKIKTDYAADGKVAFNFCHALASINVTIDASDDGAALDANTRIYVRSVTFEGLALKGDLDLNKSTEILAPATTAKPLWYEPYINSSLVGEPVTIFDGRRDGREGVAEMPNETPVGFNPAIIQSGAYTTPAFASTTPGVVKDAVNLFVGALADDIYVIPTDMPLRVTIAYDVETYDENLLSGFLSDGQAHGSTIENVITKAVTLGGNALTLEAGKKYTIGLHLGMRSVKADATIAAWVTEATPGEANLPE